MRRLPLDHPGTADARSPWRFLWWTIKGQWHTVLLGMLFGVIWMTSAALVPAVIHRLFLAHDADRVAVVEDGVITEFGSHHELVASGGSYADLWTSWHQ